MQAHELKAKWAAHRAHSRMHLAPTFADGGLFLGAQTNLAVSTSGARTVSKKNPQVDEARLAALLSAAYGRPIGDTTLGYLRRAIETHVQGDVLRASTHLALAGLGKLDPPEAGAYRAFIADELMLAGATPRDILRALDFDPSQIDRVEKYSSDQPRVPAGNGRPSGQWTRGGNAGTAGTTMFSGTGSANGVPPDAPPNHSFIISTKVWWPSDSGQVVSDANPDPIRPGQQFAQDTRGISLDPKVEATNTALLKILQAGCQFGADKFAAAIRDRTSLRVRHRRQGSKPAGDRTRRCRAELLSRRHRKIWH
jgi:hypothetical protein